MVLPTWTWFCCERLHDVAPQAGLQPCTLGRTASSTPGSSWRSNSPPEVAQRSWRGELTTAQPHAPSSLRMRTRGLVRVRRCTLSPLHLSVRGRPVSAWKRSMRPSVLAGAARPSIAGTSRCLRPHPGRFLPLLCQSSIHWSSQRLDRYEHAKMAAGIPSSCFLA